MLVTPPGGRLWRLRYRTSRAGKLSLERHPDVTLKRVRGEKRDDAFSLIVDGIDPSARRKAERGATFEAVATEWLELHRRTLCGDHLHSRDAPGFLYPYIGKLAR